MTENAFSVEFPDRRRRFSALFSSFSSQYCAKVEPVTSGATERRSGSALPGAALGRRRARVLQPKPRRAWLSFQGPSPKLPGSIRDLKLPISPGNLSASRNHHELWMEERAHISEVGRARKHTGNMEKL